VIIAIAIGVCAYIYTIGFVPGSISLVFAIITAILIFLAQRRHSDEPSIDAFSWKSRLRDVNANLKGVFVVALTVLCLAADSIVVSLALFALGCVLTSILGGVPVSRYLSALAAPAAFVLVGGAALMLDFGNADGVTAMALGTLRVVVVTDGRISAIRAAGRALGVISIVLSYSMSTPIGQVVELMRSLRVPEIVIELAWLVYRYIYVMFDTRRYMSQAAASRMGFSGNARSLKTHALIYAQMLFLGFRRSSDHMSAMDARCYDGSLSFLETRQRAKPTEVAFCFACLLALAGLAVLY
jgi:cobalt/nickel transport system permease protein